mmetsp:Transcript_2457/g.5865  ORF Transcript_2457/g.5865 Transcript_2457/m.5865 type:complete len:274 (+) Transcript_2457:743-1564(+)
MHVLAVLLSRCGVPLVLGQLLLRQAAVEVRVQPAAVVLVGEEALGEGEGGRAVGAVDRVALTGPIEHLSPHLPVVDGAEGHEGRVVPERLRVVALLGGAHHALLGRLREDFDVRLLDPVRAVLSYPPPLRDHDPSHHPVVRRELAHLGLERGDDAGGLTFRSVLPDLEVVVVLAVGVEVGEHLTRIDTLGVTPRPGALVLRANPVERVPPVHDTEGALGTNPKVVAVDLVAEPAVGAVIVREARLVPVGGLQLRGDGGRLQGEAGMGKGRGVS